MISFEEYKRLSHVKKEHYNYLISAMGYHLKGNLLFLLLALVIWGFTLSFSIEDMFISRFGVFFVVALSFYHLVMVGLADIRMHKLVKI